VVAGVSHSARFSDDLKIFLDFFVLSSFFFSEINFAEKILDAVPDLRYSSHLMFLSIFFF